MPAPATGKIIAVVPTRDRLAELRASIASIRSQTRLPDGMIAVANGAVAAVHAWLAEQTDVETVVLPGNRGPIEGFHRGVLAARRHGADWIWFMDDDATAEPQTLERLLAAIDALADHADGARAIIGAAPTFAIANGRRETGWLWGARAAAGHGRSANVPGEPGFTDTIDWAPFAGLLLRGDAYDQIGPLRSEFFLPHADMEYCLRARIAGWELAAAPAAVVHHPTYALGRRQILGRMLEMMRLSPWREYYETRNAAVMRRELRAVGFGDEVPFLRRVEAEARRDLTTILTDRQGLRRVLMRLLGWFDGIRGVMDRRISPG